MRLPKGRPPIHPGEILLEEFLKPMRISQYKLAKECRYILPARERCCARPQDGELGHCVPVRSLLRHKRRRVDQHAGSLGHLAFPAV